MRDYRRQNYYIQKNGFTERAAQQFSYERNSQAQSLTAPPICLECGGIPVDMRRMAFQVVEKDLFDLTICADDALFDSDLIH